MIKAKSGSVVGDIYSYTCKTVTRDMVILPISALLHHIAGTPDETHILSTAQTTTFLRGQSRRIPWAPSWCSFTQVLRSSQARVALQSKPSISVTLTLVL